MAARSVRSSVELASQLANGLCKPVLARRHEFPSSVLRYTPPKGGATTTVASAGSTTKSLTRQLRKPVARGTAFTTRPSFMIPEHHGIRERLGRPLQGGLAPERFDARIAPLERLPGLSVALEPRPNRTHGFGPNVFVTIRTSAGTDRYTAEANAHVSTKSLGALLSQLERLHVTTDARPMLLTTHATRSIADALASRGIAYADTTGNAHLNGPSAYVLVQGRRPDRSPGPNTTPEGLRDHATELPNVFGDGELAADALSSALNPASLALHVPAGTVKRVAVYPRLRHDA